MVNAEIEKVITKERTRKNWTGVHLNKMAHLARFLFLVEEVVDRRDVLLIPFLVGVALVAALE